VKNVYRLLNLEAGRGVCAVLLKNGAETSLVSHAVSARRPRFTVSLFELGCGRTGAIFAKQLTHENKTVIIAHTSRVEIRDRILLKSFRWILL
jgi:hypothetical protein